MGGWRQRKGNESAVGGRRGVLIWFDLRWQQKRSKSSDFVAEQTVSKQSREKKGRPKPRFVWFVLCLWWAWFTLPSKREFAMSLSFFLSRTNKDRKKKERKTKTRHATHRKILERKRTSKASKARRRTMSESLICLFGLVVCVL